MLSIGMMVKNESKYLRQCLESLQPIRNAIDSELIIVDTGSTDNTVEIAKEFTDKVYYHEWTNNFSEMRNVTISYSKGEWFLVVDGDEVISNPNGIIEFFKAKKYKKYNAACISVKNFSSADNENNYSVLLSPRLFKNDADFRYEGAVHNQPKFKQPVLELKSELVHYGYVLNDKDLMERKYKRTATILQNELKNDPENIYYLFQLSVSYAMHGDFEEALEPIYNAYNIIKRKKINFRDYLYVYGQLAKTYFTNGKYKEVEDTCLEAINEDNIYIDLHFYLAKAQFMMNKNEYAIRNYKIYLEKVKNFDLSQITRDITIINDTLGNYENAYLDLSILYNRIGEFETALEFAKKILSKDILVDAFNLIILLYIKLNKFNELSDYYENEILIKHIELKDKFLGSLEQYLLQNNSKTREKIYKTFSEGNSEYSILNRLRASNEELGKDLIKKIEEFDFNNLPNYYGDLIYYLLCNKVEIENILSKTNEFRIKFYFNFLLSKYECLGIKIYEYLRAFKNSSMTFNSIRIRKILSTCVFKSNNINDEQYKEIFDDYLESGYYYLEQVYSGNIIENKLVYSMKDEEDLFIMYMHLAKKYKEDKAQYLKNLRMALNACPYMKKGIQMLGEEVSQHLVQNSDEMAGYKKRVKESITEMINNNNLVDAKKCIAEYEQIIKEDSEIYSMKAVIAIMENRLNDAELILIEALVKYSDCFDLNYNLAYVYEQMTNDQMALSYYSKACNLASDEGLRDEINSKIESFEKHTNRIR
ncbi:glycosyltransferase [Clostridium chromiireducens]|uniref:Glycosyltransferase n=1 Tax=Clostridium chromiireducens TaxID=225345 RepID=A0A399IT16_9CLOT|nr:glycosyltransferase [Clostridium chromiireducens]RII36191.1 glycosyltransferase [Clostridium chromiireducens]